MACNRQETRTFFIPTIHQLHRQNPNYSYQDLRQFIDDLSPDIIAVEIRQTDINGDSNYLKQNYPYEMWMMRYWFPETKILGFDWLGEAIEGRPIPDHYWEQAAPVTQYKNALEEDTAVAAPTEICNRLLDDRMQILQSASLSNILASEDAALTRQYYDCLKDHLQGTIHLRILDFYEQRNQKIYANIRRIQAGHPGKTVVLVTGDDHYIELKDRIPSEPLF
ncbi:hypothetical protein GCM10027051_20840 [Niabella terrae]